MVRITLQEPFLAMLTGASTYDAIPDATIVVNESGVIRQVNNSACIMVDMSRDELVGKNNHELYHPKGVDAKQCPVCCAMANREVLDGLELEIEKETSTWYSFSLSDFPGISGEKATVEVIRDVTHKRQAEQQFSTLSMLKDSIVENLPAMLFVKDAKDLRFVEWSKFAEELTGIPREKMIGKSDINLWSEEEARFFISKDKEVLSEGKLLDIPEEPFSAQTV